MSSTIEFENKKNEKYKEIVKKQYLHLIIMRKKMKALQYTNRMLKSKINNDKYMKAISTIFNEDQVSALLKKDHIQNWSNKIAQRALKLKFACGTTGYKELLQQGISLLV